MKTTDSMNPLEMKLRLLIPGYETFQEPTMTFAFREGALHPHHVLERLNREAFRFERVRLARAEVAKAIAECRRLEEATRAFCQEASEVLRLHGRGKVERPWEG